MILDDEFVLKTVFLDAGNFVDKCTAMREKTHVKLNKKNIRRIGEAILCRNAQVLFLHDNKLNDISNLKQFTRLTHLYLQNNKIVYLEGFQNLVSLVKVYLGSNLISVVENLENCRELEELYLNTQRGHEKMIFDPRTMEALGESLVVLHIQGNKISDIKELEKLKNLEELDISCNKLESVSKVAESVKEMVSLHTLYCDLNPFCTTRNYKGKLVMAMPMAKTINKTDITRGMHAFYKTITSQKRKKKSKTDDVSRIIQELPSGMKNILDKDMEHIEYINKHLNG